MFAFFEHFKKKKKKTKIEGHCSHSKHGRIIGERMPCKRFFSTREICDPFHHLFPKTSASLIKLPHICFRSTFWNAGCLISILSSFNFLFCCPFVILFCDILTFYLCFYNHLSIGVTLRIKEKWPKEITDADKTLLDKKNNKYA